MPPKILDSAETKSRILAMLERVPFVSFVTFGDAYPDVRVLAVAAKDGVDAVWFATSTESAKIAQLRKNPKAALYGYEIVDSGTMSEFRLFGTVELLTDSVSRQKIWHDEYIQHFPDGVDSPNMIVLRFKTARGMYDDYMKETGKF